MADDRGGGATHGGPSAERPDDLAHDPHVEHDPEVVASLLDRELTGPDRAVAARQVASCAACARLHEDLRTLATAAVALPTPARRRDFRLTVTDAASLREPVAAGTRLTGEMPDTREHANHDALLVAALADRTIAEPDRERAEALVARCGLCAALREDLLALRAATIAMPTPARPADYRLSPDEAARLRPRGWRRFVAAIGTSRDGFTRPLAVGLTTLGLAGLLVATVPSVLTGTTALGPGGAVLLSPSGAGAEDVSAGGGAVAPAAEGTENQAAAPQNVLGAAASDDQTEIRAGAAAPSAAPSAAPVFEVNLASPQASGAPPVAAAPAPPASDGKVTDTSGDRALAAPAGSLSPAVSDLTADSATAEREFATEPGLSALVILSGALLLAGLGLFALRRIGRRPLE